MLRTISSSSKGFTLIELMISVAIIGMLAGIAIPNFQKFTRRAKQAEAKSNLSILYVAQEAFYQEWNFYDGRFEHIGYAPEGDLRYDVLVGIPNIFLKKDRYMLREGNAVQANSRLLPIDSTRRYCSDNPSKCNLDTNGPAWGPVSFDPSGRFYTASAASNIGGGVTDIWTVNQNKTIIHLVNGE